MPYSLDLKLAAEVVNVLKRHHQTVSTAESCTGGLISSAITEIPGSSEVFRGSFIAYHSDLKVSELGVSQIDLKLHGVVSGPVAIQMANGARHLFSSHFAVSTTGVAGPGGGTTLVPVGTVCIALVGDGVEISERHVFSGSRNDVRVQAVNRVLHLLMSSIEA